MINLVVRLAMFALKSCFLFGALVYSLLFISLVLVSDYRVYPNKPHRIQRKAPFHQGQPLSTVLAAVGKDICWNTKQASKDFYIGYHTKKDVNNIASFGGMRMRTYTDNFIYGIKQQKS